MLDDVSLGVSDCGPSLRPLGDIRIVDFDNDGRSGYGVAAGSPGVEFMEQPMRTPTHGAHLCGAADGVADGGVDAAALAVGGRDRGGPVPRPLHHADYYGGTAFDPDEHRIEAVCHAPEQPIAVTGACGCV